MSGSKQPRNAKAEYWQAQTADARCSRDRANAKNDLLQARCADMAEALRSAANLLDQSPARGARVSAESAELALSIIRAALAKAGL